MTRARAVIVSHHFPSYHFVSSLTFRSTKWGMTGAQVVQAEGQPPASQIQINDSDFYHYDSSVLGKDCDLTYHFRNERLISAGYTLFDTDEAEIVSMYFALVSGLERKYGEPLEISFASEPHNARLRASDYQKICAKVRNYETKFTRYWSTNSSELFIQLENVHEADGLQILLTYDVAKVADTELRYYPYSADEL